MKTITAKPQHTPKEQRFLDSCSDVVATGVPVDDLLKLLEIIGTPDRAATLTTMLRTENRQPVRDAIEATLGTIAGGAK